MSDPNRSMNEVPALIEERRRYEAWLATLEMRRESTPRHVFDRVKADYSARLQRVDEQLALHRHSIQEERTSLNSRRSLLEAEEQLRRDERFELELRSHVGEFAGSEAEAAFQAVDEALSQLASERQGLEARIKELDALLQIRPVEPQRAAPPPRPAALPPRAPAMRAPAPAPVAAPMPAPAPVPASAPASAPAPAPVATSSANGVGDEEEGKLRTPGGTFDELAFLSEVVGMPEAERARARVSAEPADHGPVVANGPAVGNGPAIPGVRTDAAAELSSANARGAVMQQVSPVTRPLAANIPSNTPIVLRTTSQNEQAKTLKCNECGSLNYPTEWYCERCGAELAAL
ncbi:MAG TPA: hypothetical protein VLN49_22065 [Gemmatimonadaceae bacterium]|nr:hypothetical protein [Gemmatimonadaceae bacterium]